MAEITTPASGGSKTGGRRGKKLSTRVDLTPMVDLGFLLITFFVFTTTMARPSVMQLTMPADGGEPMPVIESGSLTIVPFSGNRVFYYHGMLDNALKSGIHGVTGYSHANGIGNVIRAKQLAMKNLPPQFRKKMMVIIKPTNTSNYRNVVDILDEMKINEVGSYAISDLTDKEILILNLKGIK